MRQPLFILCNFSPDPGTRKGFHKCQFISEKKIILFFFFATAGAAMSILRLQESLASRVLRCGKKKVRLDPSETNEIASTTSHRQIWNLIKDRLIMGKPVTVHSWG
ncbi:unnamed protein product [Rangifer tarandus platyrhynchus]|uniref:Uncharacterized protein n=2 Tax=Rangifer tarandus platyrhynchus TaxID=3082113 RepID=A0AC59Y3G7_RANTA|nr:unnamed protein product [Rangifer tarandus platyrhynchus]